MKNTLWLVILLALGSLAFRPLDQTAPPLPSIQLDADGTLVEEPLAAYCWPAAAGNNQCNFVVPQPFESFQNVLEVEPGQTITVLLDNSPGVPNSLNLLVTGPGTTQQAFPLEAAPQALFDVDLTPGDYVVEVEALYDDVIGLQAFVTSRFALTVRGAGPVAQQPPPSATPQAADMTPQGTVAATAEVAPPEATVELTAEALPPEATQEATADPRMTQASPAPVTETEAAPEPHRSRPGAFCHGNAHFGTPQQHAHAFAGSG
ncbi:MAG: hypothetical protein HC915_21945 [Anaerolineae bacterium]|nr:hypothetical protein [Anaerolineae bacterium]